MVPKTCSQQADNRRGPASYSGGAQSSRDFGRTEKCLLRRTLSTLSLGRHYFCSEPGFWQCHVYTTWLVCGKSYIYFLDLLTKSLCDFYNQHGFVTDLCPFKQSLSDIIRSSGSGYNISIVQGMSILSVFTDIDHFSLLTD